MTQRPAAGVLAGGLGTRMKSSTPKHFHRLLGRRMVDWVVEAARGVDAVPLLHAPSPCVADGARLLVSPSRQGAAELAGLTVAIQAEPRGTGDAVVAAHQALDGFAG